MCIGHKSAIGKAKWGKRPKKAHICTYVRCLLIIISGIWQHRATDSKY